MTASLIFTCEGQEREIALIDSPNSETLRQLKAWLPTETTIHCAKIAGCHVYWPSPILAPLENAKDIHTLAPGAFLYYPDRQYLEIIYDELQAETAAVTYLGQLQGSVDWLREFATRQRQQAGTQIFTAALHLRETQAQAAEPVSTSSGVLGALQSRRQSVWRNEPLEIVRLLANTGHNIPFGPMATADGYFRFVQESLWQLWIQPSRFSDAQRRAAAINALELGIARIGHYCHLSDSETFLMDAISCITDAKAPLQDVLVEVILYCSRMSNWVDVHIPWFPANELTKKSLGRND